jgi:glycosyltransferase involved in cell wall biosynthesis
MIRVCNTLSQASFSVTLVGRVRKKSTALNQQIFNQHRLTCWFDKGVLFYAEFQLRLFFYLLFAKVDVIGAIDADTLLPATLVAKLKGKKVVFDAHEYFTEVPELTHKHFVKRVWQTLLDICVPLAHKCYTVGPALAEVFTTQYNKPFEVVYNMPISKSINPTKKVNHQIIYQGDLNVGRGVAETIRAIQHLPVTLVVAGDGPIREGLVDLVDELNLTEKVTFLGKIAPDALHEITQQSWLGINLLDEVSLSYQYSVANKFFDYVQAHIPALCANFLEYKKLNQQYEVALLCNNQVADIEQSIAQLLSNDFLYQKMVDNCKQAANQWCWQTQEQKLIAIYQSVIHE